MSQYQYNFDIIDSIVCKIVICSSKQGYEHGSGVILKLKELNYIYILTAKHCILGKNMNYSLDEISIKILARGDNNEYIEIELDREDDILYDEDNLNDTAIIVIKKEKGKTLNNIESISVLDVDSVSNECIIRGYPAPYNNIRNNKPITISMCEYIENNILTTKTKLDSIEYEDKLYNLSGYSGGGVFYFYKDKIYITGIVYEFSDLFQRISVNPIRKYNKILETSRYNLIPMEVKGEGVDIEYLGQLIKTSFENLGIRFNRKFNVDVDLNETLSRFCITDETIISLYSTLKDINRTTVMLGNLIKEDFKIKLDILMNTVSNNKIFDYTLLKSEFDQVLNEINVELEKKYQKYSDEYYKSNKYYYFRKLIQEHRKLDEYRSALNSSTLIITGAAGIGKSHSIAQFCNEMFCLKNKVCIFILGQQLNDSSNLILMIERVLHIPYTLQKFLEQLEVIAKYNNTVIPFVIEAINEGRNSYIWKDEFNGLISIFNKYKWIKLIISIRNTYIEKCLPESYECTEGVLVEEHRGFENKSIDAVSKFFEFYEIPIPTFPVLYSEYHNPLFLHTLCKTLKKIDNKSITEYSSFSSIFNKYMDVIEDEVSRKLNYIKSLKIVKKVVNSIVEYSFKNNQLYRIDIEVFYEIVENIVGKFGINCNDIIQLLIEEGLFYIEVYGEDLEEHVQFSYERYHNILTCRYLLDELKSREELLTSIESGRLNNYLNSPYNGITEELFIMIPDKFDVEVLPLLDEKMVVRNLDNYINSLIWRNKDNISIESVKKLINKYVVVRKYYHDSFINTLIILSPIEDHPLNILFFQEYLKKLSIPIRDSLLADILYNGYSVNKTLDNLIGFCFSKSVDKFSKECLKLIIYIVSWSLCSTNLQYRNSAIRALAALFERNIDLANDTIINFANIDDPYIKEGIYCALYGAVLRVDTFNNELEELVTEVYKDIFNSEEVYPNILVRDYARGIIEYGNIKGCKISFDIKDVRTPYNSCWYDSIPTQDEIDSFGYDYIDESIDRIMYSANKIISSMATNTGDKHMVYGDFGRYVFEGWVRPWRYHFLEQELSNIVVKEIFTKWGYNPELHGEFDTSVKSYNRHRNDCERIGKRYQRIASYELIARLSDNFPAGDIEYIYSEEYSKKSQKRLEKILASLGDEIFIDYNTKDNIEEETPRKILKEYAYKGPWQIGIRGIDTSISSVNHNCMKKNHLKSVFKIPEISNEEWASEGSTEPKIDEILFFEHNGEEFVVLEMYSSWDSIQERLDKEANNYFVKAIAILVDMEISEELIDSKEVRAYCDGKNNYEISNIFAREFPWAYSYICMKEDVENEYNEEVNHIQTGIRYRYSGIEEIEDIIGSFSMPSEFIVNKLELKQVHDGMWYDKNGNLVSYDLVFDGYDNMLVIKKDSLMKLLSENKLSILWCMYTEKQGGIYYYSERKVVSFTNNSIKENILEKESWKNEFNNV